MNIDLVVVIVVLVAAADVVILVVERFDDDVTCSKLNNLFVLRNILLYERLLLGTVAVKKGRKIKNVFLYLGFIKVWM